MIDQIIVAAYLIITLIIGLYVGRNVKSIKDFAVGQRDFSTLVLVAAVFASVVDASCTVGLAGNTFSVGPILIVAYTGVAISRFILAYFIAPKMAPFMDSISSGDIFEQLYGKRAKTLMGVSTLIECTLMTGSQILAISHVLSYFFGISTHVAALGGAVVIIFYSFKGGIRSVTATDVFQFAIMLIAIPIVCGIGVAKMGGLEQLWVFLNSKGPFLHEASLNDYGKQAAIFISLALPCLYPMCVQRMLMAKNTEQIKKTFIINGMLSLPFYAIAGLIGIVTLALMPHINPKYAFPVLIDAILPIGIKGFVIAGLLAIFMSTVDSILNVGSIATAHDLIGSLVKKPLSEKTELIMVKLASILISIGAIFISLLFDNVLDVMFFVMVVGNSVFFPGYLLGLMNLHSGIKAFWIGVVTGAVTASFCLFILKIFPLYTMLIAIAANCSVHCIFYIYTNLKNTLLTNTIKESKLTHQQSSYELVKNIDYCKIFSACTLAISVLPFFIISDAIESLPGIVFLTFNACTAILSFCMLFHEIWWLRANNLTGKLWITILVLAFPVQSICMLWMRSFSIPWLLDSLLAIPIMIIITHKVVPIFYGLSIALAIAAFGFFGNTSSNLFDNFGYWSLLLHTITLASCLFLFRKRDVQLCRFASHTLIHETGRSINTFEKMAEYLEYWLPILSNNHTDNSYNQNKVLTDTEITYIKQIPSEMLEECRKARSIAKSIALRINSLSNRGSLKEICSLRECLYEAMANPAIKNNINSITRIQDKDDIKLFGDRNQLIQVFINILENALHAIREKPNPHIIIAIKNQTITIEDNGIGISSLDLPSIFDEFFSTKSSSGQGLAFCKYIIVEHGGTIQCTSQKNCFTKFQISFPTIKMEAVYV